MSTAAVSTPNPDQNSTAVSIRGGLDASASAAISIFPNSYTTVSTSMDSTSVSMDSTAILGQNSTLSGQLSTAASYVSKENELENTHGK